MCSSDLSLRSWPGGLQVGGGINDKNAAEWIENGASKVSLSDIDDDDWIEDFL